MIKEKKISKEFGLKAPDCATIAQTASKFKSAVFVVKENKKVNAKSIMGLISLNMKCGDSIFLSISGVDEDAAFSEIYNLL
ncbi:MAG: HPr family phosphocarrier protein [Bacillota bacterium]